jgi:uncharacterized protein (UPF0276 family)
MKITYLIPTRNQRILDPNDLDYLKNKYTLHHLVDGINKYFKQDIYELLLSNSLLYIYQSNIRLINEQLEQVKISLDNLLYYLNKDKYRLKKKGIIKLINDTTTYIDDLIAFNKCSL